MAKNSEDEDMYVESDEEEVDEREMALENDEISPEEEGFLEGYDDEGFDKPEASEDSEESEEDY